MTPRLHLYGAEWGGWLLVQIPEDGCLPRHMIGMTYLGTPTEVVGRALYALSQRGVFDLQDRLGAMVGMSQRTVSNWTRRGPSITHTPDRVWSLLVRLIMSPTDRTPLL